MPIYQGFRYSDRKDHILIRAYCGDDIDVNVPATIKGKPVTEIAPFAFVPEADQKWIPHNDFLKRCTNRIRSIYLPETILRLDLAFSCCFDLEEVFLPRSIESIGTGCFKRCEKLRTIHVDDGNNFYCSKNGILYSKDGRSLFCCPAAHPLQTANYLDGVEIIERSAFEFCQNLKAVTIPPSVHTIKGGAFYGCHNLESVTLHENLSLTDTAHFGHCTSLSSIVYYNMDQLIPSDEFNNCTNLKSIDIQSKIRTIGNSAFFASGLTDIVIPNGTKGINESAFMHCTALKTVSIPRSVSRIHQTAFWRCGLDYSSDTQTEKGCQTDTITTFIVVPGSKAEEFCRNMGYSSMCE